MLSNDGDYQKIMNSDEISSSERCSRSIALEHDYVHQVYEKIGRDLASVQDPLQSIVESFLNDLEPGSFVADVGCGDGKHLQNRDQIFSLGVDYCSLQTSLSRQNCQEVIMGDNLRLPLREKAFDAVLSIGVIHHFATRERRITALREITRILKIGGKLLIAVRSHATEKSQDVLMPWYDVKRSCSIDGEKRLHSGSSLNEVDEDEDEDDLEDTISLWSSDDDDDPSTITAKFFPPSRYAKATSNSLNNPHLHTQTPYKVDISEKNVPKASTDSCYNFVRAAVKRLSFTHSAIKEEEQTDSAVLSSNNETSVCVRDSLDSDSKSSEHSDTTINEDYIELLHIDDNVNMTFSTENDEQANIIDNSSSNHKEPHFDGKRGLFRSISNIFRNIPSLWTSKETKPLSDLKSQSFTSNNNLKKRMKQIDRMTRSNTTATCNLNFEEPIPFHGSEELEMTFSEADKIINDFLESYLTNEMTGSHKFKARELEPENLDYSDIVNGNNFPFSDETMSSDKLLAQNYDLKKEKMSISCARDRLGSDDFKQNKKKDLSPQEVIVSSFSREHFNCIPELKLSTIKEKENLNHNFSDETAEFDENIHSKDIIGTSKKRLKIENNSCNKLHSEEKNSWTKEKCTHSRSFTSVFSAQCTCSNIPLCLSLGNICTEMHGKDFCDIQTNNDFINEKFCSVHYWQPFLFKLKKADNDCFSKSEAVTDGFETNYSVMKFKHVSNNNSSNSELKRIFFPGRALNYESIFNNNSKRCNSLLANNTVNIPYSKTIGPFYDEDSYLSNDNLQLSSYYSMPELNKISERDQKFSMLKRNESNKTSSILSLINSFHSINNKKRSCEDLETLEHCSPLKKLDTSTTEVTVDARNKSIPYSDGVDKINLNQVSLVSQPISVSFQKLQVQDFDTDTYPNNKYAAHTLQSVTERKFEINDIDYYVTKQPVMNSEIIGKRRSFDLSCELKCFMEKNPAFESSLYSNELRGKSKTLSFEALPSILNYSCSNYDKYDNRNQQADLTFAERKLLKNQSLGNFTPVNSSNISKIIKKENHWEKGALEQTSTQTDLNGALQNSTSGFYLHNGKSEAPFSHEKSDITMCMRENDSKESKFQPQKEMVSNPNDCFSEEEKLQHMDKGSVLLKPRASEKIRSFFPSQNAEPNSLLLDSNCSSTSNSILSIKRNKSTAQKSFSAQHSPILENISSDSKTELLSSNFSSFSSKSTNSSVAIVECFPCEVQEDRASVRSTDQKSCELNKSSISAKSQSTTCELYSLDSISDVKNGATSETTFHKSQEPRIELEIKNNSSKDTADLPNIIDSERQTGSESVPQSENTDNSQSVSYFHGHAVESADLVLHRYHHLFTEDELNDLIENNVHELHVLDSFYHQSHWCIIAEKVHVWTI